MNWKNKSGKIKARHEHIERHQQMWNCKKSLFFHDAGNAEQTPTWNLLTTPFMHTLQRILSRAKFSVDHLGIRQSERGAQFLCIELIILWYFLDHSKDYGKWRSSGSSLHAFISWIDFMIAMLSER